MSITIKLAETPAERNACLRLRHKVFVEADSRFEPRPDRCLMDRFDCCGTSVLMVALSGDDVVGTARLNRDDVTIGFPADMSISKSESLLISLIPMEDPVKVCREVPPPTQFPQNMAPLLLPIGILRYPPTQIGTSNTSFQTV